MILTGLSALTGASSSASVAELANAAPPELERAKQDTAATQQCRICLQDGPLDEESLVSCCGCLGSIQHVHTRCLRQWQCVLWEQGQYSRALQCDICLQPYQCSSQHVLDALAAPALPPWERVKKHLLQLYRSPELAFKAWRCCILLGGLAAGTQHGMSGLGAGMNLGLRLARPMASLTLRLMPQFSVAAAVVPGLAPALRQALRCSCFLMVVQVALTSAAGLFGGGLLGFCLGCVGVVRLSAKASCVAAKVASGVSRAALPRAVLLAALRSCRGKQLLSLLGRHKAAPLAGA